MSVIKYAIYNSKNIIINRGIKTGVKTINDVIDKIFLTIGYLSKNSFI